MKRALKHIKTVFAIYLALYFVCNAAFLHTHKFEGKNITHAHPITGKQHTENSAETVSLFNTTAAVTAESADLPVCNISYIQTDIPLLRLAVQTRSIHTSHLRAPPAALFI